MTEQQIFTHPSDIFGHLDIAMVRNPLQYTYRTPRRNSEVGQDRQCIQLGAGFKQFAGWRNLEFPNWNCDYYIQAAGYDESPPEYMCIDHQDGPHWTPPKDWMKQKYIQSANSDSEIASYHTLDHLSPQQVVNTLREVERVLVPGGTFTNIVPHFDSTLAKECIWHQSRFGIDTFRNIFSERQYSHDGSWGMEVGLNFIFGLAERNTVLVTQLVKS